MLSLLNNILLKPYFDEKLRALKYQQYFMFAHGVLHPADTKNTLDRLLSAARPSWLKKGDIERTEKALNILAELARNYPYRTQEIIDDICTFVCRKWNKDNQYEQKWNGIAVSALKILSSFPKEDRNKHPYYVELTKIRLQDIDLKGVNLENVVLWETEFINVNMTRSNFRNTDLGGCIFSRGTSIEWGDFSGALLNKAFNKVITTFDHALLWGSKFDGARIDRCKMIISDGFDTRGLQEKFKEALEVIKV